MAFNTYPAGQIDVAGIAVPVSVDDAGQWLADWQGSRVTGVTREKVRNQLVEIAKATRSEVSVPFVTRVEGGRFVRCTVTGIHAGNRNYLVTYDDGTKGQVAGSGLSRDKVLADTAEPDEWARLVEAHQAAGRAVYAYEKAHPIDLRAAVSAAIRSVAASAGNQA